MSFVQIIFLILYLMIQCQANMKFWKQSVTLGQAGFVNYIKFDYFFLLTYFKNIISNFHRF
jgi:hypothetical protein